MIPVLTVSDKSPTEPYYCYDEFFESLGRFDHRATVLGFGEPFRGMISRLKLPLRHMRTIHDKHIIITDCWDLLFLRSPEEMVEHFQCQKYPIMFSAERTLFPAKNYGDYPTGTSDSRYLNAGFIIAEREALIELFEHLRVDEQPDDSLREDGSWEHHSEQELLHRAFVEQFISMTLDYQSEICQSMYKTEPREIDVSDDRIRNLFSGAHPMAIHWNGPAKTEAHVLPAEGVKWWREHP